MEQNTENNTNQTLQPDQAQQQNAPVAPDVKDPNKKKSSSKKLFLFIGLGAFLFGTLGVFGALYTGVWDPGWNPFNDTEKTATSSQEDDLSDEATTTFDVDQILGKELSRVEELLGEPTEENGDWQMGDVVIKIRKTRGVTDIVEQVELEFLEMEDPTYQELLLAAGIAVPDTEPRIELDTPTYYFIDGYGFISFPLLNNPQQSAPYSIVVTTQNYTIKDVTGALASAMENYFEENGEYVSSNEELLLLDRSNVLDSELAKNVWPLYSDVEFILPPEGVSYGYKSDGETYYEITVPLEDESDPQCAEEGSLCLYGIRNGELVSPKDFTIQRDNFSVEVRGLWAENSSSEETGLEIYDLNNPMSVDAGNKNIVTTVEDFEDSEDFQEMGSIENMINLLNEDDLLALDAIFLLEANSEEDGFVIAEESVCSVGEERKNVGSFSYPCGKEDGEFTAFGFVPETTALQNGHSYLFILENEETEDVDINMFRDIIESFKAK